MFLGKIYAEFWSSVASYLRKQKNFIFDSEVERKNI